MTATDAENGSEENSRIDSGGFYTAISSEIRPSIGIMRALSITVLTLMLVPAPAFAAEPVVALWYRGTPAGTPRLDDLAAIRAAGFDAITWPSAHATSVAEVSRLAERVGLTVVIQPDGRTVVPLEGRVDIDVTRVRAEQIPAMVWRAVGDGVRTISFDPGASSGPGLDEEGGGRHQWVAPAVAVARQLSANALLIGELRRARPPQFLSLRPVSLDVQLFEGSRAWVIIATNTGQDAVRAEMELPRGVPYAIWVSLVDASTIAMVDRPGGALWKLDLDPGAAKVYVIDKVLK